MNRHYLFGLALASAAAGLGVRYWAASPAPSDRPRGPAYECSGVVDFGTREQGDIALADVVVGNRGDQPLVISDVRSDCSCSGLEQRVEGRLVHLDKITVAPGTEVALVSRLMVRGAPGLPESHTVWLKTNDPSTPEAAIRLQVKLVTGVRTSPVVVQFGDVLVDEEVTREVDVLQSGTPDMAVTRAASSRPELVTATLAGRGGGRNDPLSVATFRVAARPRATGPVSASVEVEYTRSGQRFTASVPVHLTAVRAVTAYPDRVVLPLRSASGPVYETTVLCRSHAGVAFTLDVDPAPPGVEVEVTGDSELTDAAVRVVTVRVNPGVWRASPGVGSRVVHLSATRAGRRVPVEIGVSLTP